jgi:hypothetical protein
MKVKCPICHEYGSLQQRYNSVRVGHYKGYKGKTRIIEWHCTNVQAVLLVNKGKVGIDEHGKLYLLEPLFTKNEEKQHGLPCSPQTHNLENNKRGNEGARCPEVAGSNPAPLTEQASARANGTKQSPQSEDTMAKLWST